MNPLKLPDREGGEKPPSVSTKNWKSSRARFLISWRRSSCEMQIRTYCHDGPKLLPSERPRCNNALMQSMFFCLISLMVVRYVNLAKDETMDSRSVSMSNRAAIRIECLKPSMQRSTLAWSSCISSKTESVANIGQQTTSNKGLTYSMFDAWTKVPEDGRELRCSSISCDRMTMFWLSLWNSACFWASPFAARDSKRALASSSSLSENGVSRTES
mmetsp:Transcript_118419/g.334758  ORF Transcript_118419/g.334758 Transcript_118419/m.334758 type:complete len:215 (+) Transcript_118419:1507-2151(+)